MARWSMKNCKLLSSILLSGACFWTSVYAQDACSPTPCGVNTKCYVSNVMYIYQKVLIVEEKRSFILNVCYVMLCNIHYGHCFC